MQLICGGAPIELQPCHGALRLVSDDLSSASFWFLMQPQLFINLHTFEAVSAPASGTLGLQKPAGSSFELQPDPQITLDGNPLRHSLMLLKDDQFQIGDIQVTVL